MSAILEILHSGQINGDVSIQFGDDVTPITSTLTLGTAYHIEKITVPDNYGSVILWTSPNGGVSTFTFGLIISDVDIFMERRNTKGSPEFALELVPAGLPFYFGNLIGAGTTERIDGAQMILGTDFAPVDRIEVQRNVADAVGDATVQIWLFK